jgi:hypothetical protein
MVKKIAKGLAERSEGKGLQPMSFGQKKFQPWVYSTFTIEKWISGGREQKN